MTCFRKCAHENLLFFGIREGEAIDEPLTGYRHYTMVALPYWDELGSSWIVDPLTTLMRREAIAAGDPQPIPQMPPLGDDRKHPPHPLVVRLPFDVEGYNVGVGATKLVLCPAEMPAPAKAIADSPAVKNERMSSTSQLNRAGSVGPDGTTVAPLSPIFVSYHTLLSSATMAAMATPTSAPSLDSRPQNTLLAAKADSLLQGIAALHNNLLSQTYTLAEIDNASSKMYNDLLQCRDSLKVKQDELAARQDKLKRRAAALRTEFEQKQKDCDDIDEILTASLITKNGTKSLVQLNERLGELHELLGAAEERVVCVEEEEAKRKKLELKSKRRHAKKASSAKEVSTPPASSSLTPPNTDTPSATPNVKPFSA